MRRIHSFILPMILALIGMSVMAAPAQAKSYGVEDGGHFFSADAINRAEGIIADIHNGDNHDVFVATFSTIPADRQAEFKSQDQQKFYDDWAEEIGKQNGVNGIVILMVKDPGRLQIAVGTQTRKHAFTLDDRDELDKKMLPLLKQKRYDDALVEAMNFIKARMRGNANANAAPGPGSTATPGSTNYPTSPIVTRSTGIPVMGWLCAGIAILGVVFIIMSIVNRSRNYGGGGYGAPPPGGYPPGYSGGYPQGGGYYGGGGGGGGGFGRGLLGGLLGGALGAWGYERFNQGSGTSNYNPPPAGGGGNFGATPDQSDTSYSSTGGDFGSSNDPGSSDSSSSGGGDFGSSSDSSGGSDFGSSGGDFGGGGDSGGGGGDSGGGGGDF